MPNENNIVLHGKGDNSRQLRDDKTAVEKNTEIINQLRISGSPADLCAAQCIEELEKQVVALEFQVKIAPVRACIEMYDQGTVESGDLYSFLQNFLFLQGEEPTETWQVALVVIWGKWDDSYGSQTCDPDEYIDQVREVIGMAIPS